MGSACEGKVRIGFVGLGHNAEGHIRAHRNDPRSEIVAVCDIWEDRARGMAERYGIPNWHTDDSIYERDDLDAISIHTPDHLHAQPFVKALSAGKHVFVEKPMGNSIEDLEMMVSAARSRPDLITMVGQILRFNPVFVRIHEIVSSGQIGEVFYMEADYIHNLKYQGEGRFNPAIEMNWYLSREIPMVGGGVHPFDLLRWFAGDVVEEATGYGNGKAFPEMKNNDCQAALFRFRKGAMAKVASVYGCVCPFGRLYNLMIYGTRGTINRDSICLSDDPEKYIPLGVELPQGHPYEPEDAHFIDCILGGKRPVVDAIEGANSAAPVILAAQSAALGRPVKVPVFGSM
ncbi:MAG TPA: Gfo/Idh/MocA family oxidoreductase [Candidatus Brocadiia bacterium]|nr:Gfo/Idh/MocA family oxidoreductase [Candidatus Brocadiia bacterium]